MSTRVGAALAATMANFFLATTVLGHPGSGIVLDREGNVFFTDTGHGVWKIDAKGQLTHTYPSTGHHWLSLAPAGRFPGTELRKWVAESGIPNFDRVSPALIAADGQPFVVGGDGNLYYAKRNLELMRLTPQGRATPLVPGMADDADKLGGIKGLAWGPDGCLYASYPNAVQRITMDGKTTFVVRSIVLDDCKEDVDPAMTRPYLRGLSVDADGTIYAAATNCRRVLKIAPDGKVSTVLTSPAPWTPTGVATAKDEVYVLEYRGDPHSESDPSFPRVTLVGHDGKIRVLAEVTAKLSPR